MPISGNYYCNPALAKDGHNDIYLVPGSAITAYKPGMNLKPVSDFRLSITTASTGQPVYFFDQSSYIPVSWQWYFPGATIISSTSQNPGGIVYSSPGVYDVMLVTANASGSDSIAKTCFIKIEQASAIHETDLLSPVINVHPNPANEVIFITINTLNKNFTEGTVIRMIDVDAKEVFNIPFNIITEIPASEFKNGIYLLQIITRYKIESRKIIISH